MRIPSTSRRWHTPLCGLLLVAGCNYYDFEAYAPTGDRDTFFTEAEWDTIHALLEPLQVQSPPGSS